MGGLNRAIDRGEQFVAHGVEVDRIAQSQGEGGDDRIGVVAGTVEAAIDDPLDTPPERVEQCGRRQRRGGDARPATRTAARGRHATIPTNTPPAGR